MAYNNNYGQNNSAQKSQYGSTAKAVDNNVSSNGVAFMNEAAGKMLNFNYWGRTVTLEIANFQPGTPITWEMRKGAQLIKCAISFTSLADLADICDEVIDSIKANGTFTPVGIRVGAKRDSILEISNGENIGMPTGIYLVLYKGVDAGGRTNNMAFYTFDNTRFIRGYNHQTGAMREDINKIGEFKKFRKAVNAAADAFTMAQAHTIAELKKGDKMASYKALCAIGAAMGVNFTETMSTPLTTGTSSYSKNQNNGTYGSNYNKSGYRPKTQGQYNGGYQKPYGSAPRTQSNSTFERPNTNSYQAALNAMGDEPVDINLDITQLQNVDLNKFGG